MRSEWMPNNLRYNMIVPQHPFITVLLHNSHSWIDIFGNISQIQNKNLESDVDTRQLMNAQMRPFYLYVFCDYNNKVLPAFRQKLWSHWMSNYFAEDFLVYMDIFTWLKVYVIIYIIICNNNNYCTIIIAAPL